VLGDVRLWITVGLVALFAIAWSGIFAIVGHPLSAGSADFLPLGVFLVPVLYASISFGVVGGLVLAAASIVATVPWAVLSIRRQYTLGAWFDVVQLVALVVVAYFVGKVVRAEREAREMAERTRQDHLLAEIRYHDLFDTNSQPILLADLSGVVQEANVAAGDLFGRGKGPLRGTVLRGLVGGDIAAALREGKPLPRMVEVPGEAGSPSTAVFRPVARMVVIDGQPMLQVVLQDVTEDARRRARAQEYVADVLTGQEDERRRIAQELHDGPLQTLIHLCRLIDAARAGDGDARPPAAGSSGPSPPVLAQLRSATESVAAEVGQIARGLRPPSLDDLGLLAAVEGLCDDVERRAGVAASLEVEGEVPRLSAPVELTVYRIVQEALSNVSRHSGAATVDVRLEVAGGWLQMRVTDDGEGFDSYFGSVATGGGSLGLSGMSERAELVGGSLRVLSRAGGGTTVVLAVPVAAARDSPPRSGGPAVAPDGERDQDHEEPHGPGQGLPDVGHRPQGGVATEHELAGGVDHLAHRLVDGERL